MVCSGWGVDFEGMEAVGEELDTGEDGLLHPENRYSPSNAQKRSRKRCLELMDLHLLLYLW